MELAEEARVHVDRMTEHVIRVISDGVAQGQFYGYRFCYARTQSWTRRPAFIIPFTPPNGLILALM